MLVATLSDPCSDSWDLQTVQTGRKIVKDVSCGVYIITIMLSKLIVLYYKFVIACTVYLQTRFESRHALSYNLLRYSDQDSVFKLLDTKKKNIHILYLTRSNRHKLYCLLKSKKSPYAVFSFGVEDAKTRKKIIIKRK